MPLSLLPTIPFGEKSAKHLYLLHYSAANACRKNKEGIITYLRLLVSCYVLWARALATYLHIRSTDADGMVLRLDTFYFVSHCLLLTSNRCANNYISLPKVFLTLESLDNRVSNEGIMSCVSLNKGW